jgi:glycosyltransferase involved in cell wall biosynthesis
VAETTATVANISEPRITSHVVADNRVIHSLWLGRKLRLLQQLTLRSFTHHGHAFSLWVYDELDGRLPVGVSLCDASLILPRERLREILSHVAECDRVKVASAVFRARLLHEKGGIFIDDDVTCLRPFEFVEPYLFGPSDAIVKCPPGDQLMRAARDAEEQFLREPGDEPIVLQKHIDEMDLGRFVRADIANAEPSHQALKPFVARFMPIPEDWHALRWGEAASEPAPGSTLFELYRFYRLIDPWVPYSAPRGETLRTPRAIAPQPRAKHLNVLMPAVMPRDAAKTVAETIETLRARKDVVQSVHVLAPAAPAEPHTQNARFSLSYAADDAAGRGMRGLAFDVLACGHPVVVTHFIAVAKLRKLWQLGIATIPVVHEPRALWLDAPTVLNDDHVPFVIACADAVAQQLRQSGCERPVVTLRHELQHWFTPEETATARRRVRDRHGIDGDTLLIGMVGAFEARMAHTRALRVLSAIEKFYPAKLMILGARNNSQGRVSYEALMRQAVELGVVANVIILEDVEDADPYLSAFDVFLDTSTYEGLSLPLLEAIQAGCPVVSAGAGGNREVLTQPSALVADPSEIDSYVASVTGILEHGEHVPLPKPADHDLVPRLLSLLATQGVDLGRQHPTERSGTLFVTEALRTNGSSRLLVDLIGALPASSRLAVCALEGISVPAWGDQLANLEIPSIVVPEGLDLLDRAERVIAAADMLNVRNICFWRVPAELKLLLAKIVAARAVRLIDVWLEPEIPDEFAGIQDFQRRISLSARGYFERLDALVVPDAGTAREPIISANVKDVRAILPGVAKAPRFVPLPRPEMALPKAFDPALAIGTCCRVAPEANLEMLLDMMGLLVERLPGASLTIVGGPDRTNFGYWESVLKCARNLSNVRFVGRHDDVNPFLAQFKLFVTATRGFPHASIEAMAMGLPVVAAPGSGAAQQIVNGVNGYAADGVADMAARIAELLCDPPLCRAFGEASRNIAQSRFALERMVEAYGDLLEG